MVRSIQLAAYATVLALVRAQSCQNSGYQLEEFEPYFFMSEMDNPNITCNIDPSQANLTYAVAIGGEFCLDSPDTITMSLAYTGTDGQTSTAMVTTAINQTYTSSIDLIFTGLPAAAISNGSVVTVTAYDYNASSMTTLCGSTTSSFSRLFTATQLFVPTLAYVQATNTSTLVVPASTTVTSTVTAQDVTSTSAQNVTITTTSGAVTINAAPSTFTSTSTIRRKVKTKKITTTITGTTTATCIPTKSTGQIKRAAPAWVGRYPHSGIVRRQDTSSSSIQYITGSCSSTIDVTSLTTGTDYSTTTSVGSSTSTDTEYAITTTTSVYTPTNTFYLVVASTVTTTPTVTKKKITVMPRATTKATYTTHVTKTSYPSSLPSCSK